MWIWLAQKFSIYCMNFYKIKVSMSIAGLVASVLTIIQYFAELEWLYSVEIIVVTPVILAYLVLFLIVLNKQKQVETKKVNNNIRDLIIHIKNNIDRFVNIEDGKISQEVSENYIFKILCTAESIFRELSKHKCTASLMLVDENNELYTNMYGSNAHANRREKPSERKLGTTKGIAGKVFGTSKVVAWSDKDIDFEVIRSDYKDFYLSGISAPVIYKESNTGILNIDCHSRNAFKLNKCENAMNILTDIINITIKLLEQKEESILSKQTIVELNNKLDELQKKPN